MNMSLFKEVSQLFGTILGLSLKEIVGFCWAGVAATTEAAV